MNIKKYKKRFILGLLLIAVFSVLSFVSLHIFGAYPFSMDEYNYLYQAQIFATGHTFIHASEKLHDLFELYMVYDNGKLFTKYPPGMSLLLLPGVKLGVPALINPLISVISLIFIYLLCAEFAGSFIAFLTAVLIACNVYFIGYSASFFAQPASMCLTCIALYCYVRFRRTGREHFLLYAMSAIAFNFLVRPLDAFCLWAVMGMIIIIRNEMRERSFLYGLLPAAGLLILIGYNHHLAGHWSIAPYSVTGLVTPYGTIVDFQLFYGNNWTFFGTIVGLINGVLSNLIIVFPLLLFTYFLPLIVCWLPFILLGLTGIRSDRTEFRDFCGISLAYMILFIILYAFHPTIRSNQGGWPQYGARYWYPFIVPMTGLIAWGIKILYDRVARRYFWIIIGACLIVQFAQAVYFLDIYSLRFQVMHQVRADIISRCPSKSIIVLNDPNYWDNVAPPFTVWLDLKRNPFLNGDRLYLIRPSDLDAVKAAYPDYAVRQYHFPWPYNY